MIKRFAQAWAFASVLLLPNYVDLISGAGDARMRSPIPLTPIALAHLTDMAMVIVLFAGILFALRRTRAWPVIRWALLALLPVLLLIRNLGLFPFHVPAPAVAAVSLAWFGLLALLPVRLPARAVQLRNAGSTLFAAFAVFAVVMTFQLGRAALWRPGPQAFSLPIAAAPASRPRLVWVIFDELAYKPVFETRDPSLSLPNFDRLRTESTLYTNATPIAYKTLRVVPSLQLGRRVTDVAFGYDNHYQIRFQGSSRWQRFPVSDSLFAMAAQHGLTISIVGWYIAYCPTFAGIATDCYWGNGDAQDRGPALPSAGYAENCWIPLRIMAEQAIAPRRAWTDDARIAATGHLLSVKEITSRALRTLPTTQADIVYLHLPTPHPPAVWNRHANQFGFGGSYLDSLALTDQLLGRILDTLQSQPRWASTMLIVHGDHSWRTQLWRPLPGWSSEDERISQGGEWDPRPLVMIHAPGQQTAKTVSAPTSLMMVHDTVADRIRSFAH
ncbi:MAG: sulfatase-like hydrolase/transferase [Terracidiphilus sp.]